MTVLVDRYGPNLHHTLQTPRKLDNIQICRFLDDFCPTSTTGSEGIRVYNGRVFHLDRHLDRLFRSAKALGFANVHTRSEITDAVFRVLAANGMRDGAHMRLTLTRGEKCTSSMNPAFNVYGTTLIVLPEWKPTEGATTSNEPLFVSGGITAAISPVFAVLPALVTVPK